VRAAVAEQPFELPGGVELTRTCSVGFASYPFIPAEPRRVGWQEVVGIVDMALPAAKRGGRNGWVGIRATEAVPPEALVQALKPSTKEALDRGAIALATTLDPARVAHVL